MKLPILRLGDVHVARCAEPYDLFAQWCGGSIVDVQGRVVAVTMPKGSSDLACWPGEYIFRTNDEFMRTTAAGAEAKLPAHAIESLQGTP